MTRATKSNLAATTGADPRDPTLTREDWLALALKTLVRDGIDRVKVQIMARKLDVARSSFYWHFVGREDLHSAMLEEWLTKNTGPILERAMRPAPDVNAAVMNVFECWVDTRLFDPELDIAVRLWARRDAKVRQVVLQADLTRVKALTEMFQRYGNGPEEALIRARVLYFTQIGHYTLDDTETPETRVSHAPTYMKIFSGVEADPAACIPFMEQALKTLAASKPARGRKRRDV